VFGNVEQDLQPQRGNAIAGTAVDDSDALVIQAPTRVLNPTLDEKVIARARAEDPEAAASEWDAEFRSDLSSLLDDATIDASIDHGRPLELPPGRGHQYRAFTDASAGRHDAFTICIGHKEDDRFIADVIRGRKPPFDPAAVAEEYARLAQHYGCPFISGDNFAGEWVRQAFTGAGIDYRKSELTKSKLYLEGVSPFNRGAIRIPDHPQLLRELRLLERRVQRSGADGVDHPRHGSDDYANSLFGAGWLVLPPENPALRCGALPAFLHGWGIPRGRGTCPLRAKRSSVPPPSAEPTVPAGLYPQHRGCRQKVGTPGWKLS
jgi:hypothetical protein